MLYISVEKQRNGNINDEQGVYKMLSVIEYIKKNHWFETFPNEVPEISAEVDVLVETFKTKKEINNYFREWLASGKENKLLEQKLPLSNTASVIRTDVFRCAALYCDYIVQHQKLDDLFFVVESSLVRIKDRNKDDEETLNNAREALKTLGELYYEVVD